MKSPAPFFSPSPSGSFAGFIVASRWKGRNYLRELVIPSNPSTAGQIAIRLVLGSIAKGARAVLTSFADVALVGSQFFQDARDLAPSGQSWISWMQRYAQDIYDKTNTHWAQLDGTEQGYFDTNAATAGLADYTPTLGGNAQVGLTAGQQLMALGFFAKDYLENSIGTDAVGSNSPTNQNVLDLEAYVHDTV